MHIFAVTYKQGRGEGNSIGGGGVSWKWPIFSNLVTNFLQQFGHGFAVDES